MAHCDSLPLVGAFPHKVAKISAHLFSGAINNLSSKRAVSNAHLATKSADCCSPQPGLCHSQTFYAQVLRCYQQACSYKTVKSFQIFWKQIMFVEQDMKGNFPGPVTPLGTANMKQANSVQSVSTPQAENNLQGQYTVSLTTSIMLPWFLLAWRL